MAKTVCFLILLLVLPSIPIPVNSLHQEFFFNGFSGAASSSMSVDGCAAVEPDGLLRLTNLTTNLMGNAFYSTPIKFKNSTTGKAFSFSTAFAFPVFSWDQKPSGHSFAFSLSPSKALPHQHLGIVHHKHHSLLSVPFPRLKVIDDMAIEFEETEDKNFFLAVFNGQLYTVDVDFDLDNLLNSNNAAHVVVINSKSTRSVVIQAWLDYHSENNLLEIRLSPYSSKPILPNFSWNVDLSPILNETMYVGFSASTSIFLNRQYILGWSFKVNGGEATSLDLETLPSLLRVLKEREAALEGKRYRMRIKLPVFTVLSLILLFALFGLEQKIAALKKRKGVDLLPKYRFEEGKSVRSHSCRALIMWVDLKPFKV